MLVRRASATWHGSIGEGHGHMEFGDFEGSYSVASRFEDGEGTNPEELLGAAHAGCFSMALSSNLSAAGHPPKSVETSAQVHIDKLEAGWTVTRVHLVTKAEVAGLEAEAFQEFAEDAKANCPISRALAGVEITLEASLS
ncbi:MAG: OsmC family peroxiredoxin [Chloroflexi bacterium]|nr:OsmC family peroxiredoxin [Chloroflexota bacterium]MDK1044204.1 OsmC family peroxiredoxin [Anaerolineales bacterium]MCH8340813.1 OsmC family peroxiredoxin [Chloroflexota bacterium]MCH8876890.1 OsmC family peroxiredoxin [Chloroflexota bacterium]MCI0772182.1 OsmC family peroxiredoxin [Chloroflexota bacterium]